MSLVTRIGGVGDGLGVGKGVGVGLRESLQRHPGDGQLGGACGRKQFDEVATID
jgi:hypothetical protein